MWSLFFGEEKKECSNCRHYSLLFGCPYKKGDMNYCSRYENASEYKEKKRAEEREREERRRIIEENERLKWENSKLEEEKRRINNSQNSNLKQDPQYEVPRESIKSLNELELEAINVLYVATNELPKIYESLLAQIKSIRASEEKNIIIDRTKLDDFLFQVKDLNNAFDEALQTYSNKTIAQIKQIKLRFDGELCAFLSEIKREVMWHISNGNFVIAFLLSKSCCIIDLDGFKSDYNRCKKPCFDFIVAEAKELEESKKYDEAVSLLKSIKDDYFNEEIKRINATKEKYVLATSKKLIEKGRYDDAIKLLKSLNTQNAKDMIVTCHIDKALKLYAAKNIDGALVELKKANTKDSELLSKKIKSNIRKKKMQIAGLILLIVGVVLLIVAIISSIMVSKVMEPDISYEEACRIIDAYTPWEVIGFLFGIPLTILGIVFTIIGSKKYRIF